MEFLAEYGYIGLFLSAFLAATILPVSSEAVLTMMVIYDFNLTYIILIATIGNVLGAMVNYWLGYRGSSFFLHKLFRISDQDIRKAETRFQKYGAYSMLLAWVPIIGDPLTVVAGVFKMNFWLFAVLVTVGKFVRYFLLALGIDLM